MPRPLCIKFNVQCMVVLLQFGLPHLHLETTYNFFSSSTMRSPVSFVLAVPPRSAVLSPSSRTFRTAASIALAGFSSPREYLKSKAALRIVPMGLAIPLPAMSGADPCIGSYSPGVGLKSGDDGDDGAPARDADGRRPKDPGMTLD